MKNKLTNEELYILKTLFIHMKYGRVIKSNCPKNKILAIQMKLLSMEESNESRSKI